MQETKNLGFFKDEFKLPVFFMATFGLTEQVQAILENLS
jgi:hypothetical protein